MKKFQCPKCGGSFFGVIMNEKFTPVAYECHTRIKNGELLPSSIYLAERAPFGRPCGWNSAEFKCMTEVANEN